jgi:DNA-binding XRE family transcriptional regulator
MSLNEQIIGKDLGQRALKCKPILSCDYANSQGQHVGMDAVPNTTGFKRSFLARVKQARKEADYSQEEIAELLGMKQDKYKQYEVRSFMPQRKEADYSQEEIAELLGMKQDKYKQYEVRSFMPHWLIPRFCMACRISIEWLFTGRQGNPRKIMTSPRMYADN